MLNGELNLLGGFVGVGAEAIPTLPNAEQNLLGGFAGRNAL